MVVFKIVNLQAAPLVLTLSLLIGACGASEGDDSDKSGGDGDASSGGSNMGTGGDDTGSGGTESGAGGGNPGTGGAQDLPHHEGVCGCESTELCISASSIGDMSCAPGVACDPFDCDCFTSGDFEDPCPDDFECDSTNWPLVTCVRASGSNP